jgi:hypothetical protein
MDTLQSHLASVRERRFKRMNEFVSDYAQHDHVACRILLGRLESAARLKRLVTYDEFVRGVTFVFPDRNQSMRMVTRTVDTSVIKTEDEAIIHDFGRYLAGATFRDSSIFINALLIRSKSYPHPPVYFYDWLRRAHSIYMPNQSAEQEYWDKSVAAVHRVYSES